MPDSRVPAWSEDILPMRGDLSSAALLALPVERGRDMVLVDFFVRRCCSKVRGSVWTSTVRQSYTRWG